MERLDDDECGSEKERDRFDIYTKLSSHDSSVRLDNIPLSKILTDNKHVICKHSETF